MQIRYSGINPIGERVECNRFVDDTRPNSWVWVVTVQAGKEFVSRETFTNVNTALTSFALKFLM
jgi:hypothetical protein